MHLKIIALLVTLVASNCFAATNTLHDKNEKTSPSVNDETYIWDITDSALKKSTVGNLPISTATQTALNGKANTSAFASQEAFASAWGWAPGDNLGSDDNYVTDAEKVKLGNLSGTNSGDQTATTTPSTAFGTYTSTNVQALAQEIDTALRGLISAGGANVAVENTWSAIQNFDAGLTASGMTITINALSDIKFGADNWLNDSKGNGDANYLWSADKIVDQLALKSDATHDHTGTYQPYDANMILWPSGVTANEITYVDFTSSGQAQIDEAIARATPVFQSSDPTTASTPKRWYINTTSGHTWYRDSNALIDVSAGTYTLDAVQYTLTISPPDHATLSYASDILCGTGGSDCTQDYDNGTVLTGITITPDSGYSCNAGGGWTGDITGTNCTDGTVTMSANKSGSATVIVTPPEVLVATTRDAAGWTSWDGGTSAQIAADLYDSSNTTYIYANEGAATDTYNMADTSTPGTITNVTVHVIAKAAVAGNTITIGLSNTSTNTASKTLTDSFAEYTHIVTVDPATSSAWLNTGINSSKMYLRSGTTTGQIQIAEAWYTVTR